MPTQATKSRDRVAPVAKADAVGESTAALDRVLPIGAAIRDRRQRLSMTLQALAGASGLSAPFLSQVERDLAMPSLISLTAIAGALGVDMSYFVGTPSAGQIVRRGDQPETLRLGTSPVDYTRLSGRHEERKLEALMITVPPGVASPMAQREGEGFWYILAGEIDVWVGQEHFHLATGDSTHFDQRHPYRMRNNGEVDVKMIWVGTPALL